MRIMKNAVNISFKSPLSVSAPPHHPFFLKHAVERVATTIRVHECRGRFWFISPKCCNTQNKHRVAYFFARLIFFFFFFAAASFSNHRKLYRESAQHFLGSPLSPKLCKNGVFILTGFAARPFILLVVSATSAPLSCAKVKRRARCSGSPR